MVSEIGNLDNLLEGFLTKEDCQKCQSCCYFHDNDKIDAPLFDESQKNRIIMNNPEQEIKFEKVGRLWKIILDEIQEGTYVCPLLDQKTHLCTARKVDCFDCRTWPFYIADIDGHLAFTVSRDCPAVQKTLDNNKRDIAIKKILPYMLSIVMTHQELIAKYRDDMDIISYIGADSEN